MRPSTRAELRRAAPYYLSGIDEHFLALLDANERAVLTTALQRVALHHQEKRPKAR